MATSGSKSPNDGRGAGSDDMLPDIPAVAPGDAEIWALLSSLDFRVILL